MIYRPIQYVCAFVWKGAEKVIGREEKESGSRSSTRLATRLRISGRPCLAVLIASLFLPSISSSFLFVLCYHHPLPTIHVVYYFSSSLNPSPTIP